MHLWIPSTYSPSPWLQSIGTHQAFWLKGEQASKAQQKGS